MMQVRLARGDEAAIVRLAGESITLAASVSAPPGATLDGTIEIGASQDRARAALRVKVSGSKKQPDGSFVIDGRCVDMTRELRQELELRCVGVDPKSPVK